MYNYSNSKEEIKQLCNRLKEIIDMREWLSELGLQDKGGGRYLCPFHSETRPSFTATRSIAMDWHENKPYDIFSIARALKGWSFKETLEKACQFAGLNQEEWIKVLKDTQETPAHRILKFAKYNFYKYKDEILKKFSMQKGYEIPEKLYDELYYFPEDSEHPQRGRLCVVWRDVMGNPIGFVGRALAENLKPKYKYTGIEIGSKFSKTCFFNIHRAKFSEKVLIVEGVWDALIASMYTTGVVATGGVVSPKITFFSDFEENGFFYKRDRKVGIFSKLKALIFAPDPDDVGVSAFLKSIDNLYTDIMIRGADCYGVLLTKDLDEMIMKDNILIDDIFKSAKKIKDFIIDIRNKYEKEYQESVNSSVDKGVIKRLAEQQAVFSSDRILQMIADRTKSEIEILREIAKLEYETEREKYIMKLSEVRKISKTALYKDLKQIQKTVNSKKLIEKLNLADKNKIAHPAYYVDENIALVGFSFETVDKTTNEILRIPLKIIRHNHNKQVIVTEEKTIDLGEYTYVFNDKNRNLPPLTEFWAKEPLEELLQGEIRNVPLAKLYEVIQQIFKSYVELSNEESYKVLSLYCIMTYFYGCFPSIPFLFVFGPKGSGKSHLLSILSALSMNAVKCKGITIAALGDTVDSYKGTLIIDQAETLSLPNNLEIIGILADSYNAMGGKRRIVSIENGTRKVLELETFCPKIFASVKEIDDDLRDRTILIQMIKSTRKFKKPNFSSDIWRKIRGELYKNFLKHGSKVYVNYRKFHSCSERSEEILQPLIFLMQYMGLPDYEIGNIAHFLRRSISFTQFEMAEDEKTLMEGILDSFGMFSEEIRLTDKDIKDILIKKNINKNIKWAISKMKQFSLIKDIIKEKEGTKGIRYYLIDRETVENVYDRYFFTSSNDEATEEICISDDLIDG